MKLFSLKNSLLCLSLLQLLSCNINVELKQHIKADESSGNQPESPPQSQIKVEVILPIMTQYNQVTPKESYTEVLNGSLFPAQASTGNGGPIGNFDLTQMSCPGSRIINYDFRVTNVGTTQLLEHPTLTKAVVTKTSPVNDNQYIFSIVDDLDLPIEPNDSDVVTVQFERADILCRLSSANSVLTNSWTYDSFDLSLNTNSTNDDEFNLHVNIFGNS